MKNYFHCTQANVQNLPR